MSIEQEKKIDILASGKKPNEVVLFITDHLPWNSEFARKHLTLLEKKLNNYLAYIEGGEIYDKYPQHKGKIIIINVIGKYPLNDEAEEYYKKVTDIIEKAGFKLEFELAKE